MVPLPPTDAAAFVYTTGMLLGDSVDEAESFFLEAALRRGPPLFLPCPEGVLRGG